MNRAPSLIVSNVNYVKKVIFPLEILPVISLGAALFHFIVSFLVLTIAIIVVDRHLNWTIIYLPVVMLPLILIIMGISCVNNFDFSGHMEYPLLSFTVGMNNCTYGYFI